MTTLSKTWSSIFAKTVLGFTGPISKRRNSGPKATKILVTNLPDVNRRTAIALYWCRWNAELLIQELKGVTGLGQAPSHQGTSLHRALRRFIGDGLSDAAPVSPHRYSPQRSLECLYPQAEFRLADYATAARTYLALTPQKVQEIPRGYMS